MNTKSTWLSWINRLEAQVQEVLGRSFTVDGDQSKDGWSTDYFTEAWRGGAKVEEAISEVFSRVPQETPEHGWLHFLEGSKGEEVKSYPEKGDLLPGGWWMRSQVRPALGYVGPFETPGEAFRCATDEEAHTEWFLGPDPMGDYMRRNAL